MSQILYSHAALKDLEGIADYTGRMWGSEQAKRYLWEVRGHIRRLPNGGVATKPLKLRRGLLFSTPINRHIVLFEATQDQILVIRILHQSMDLPQHL